MSLSAKVSCRFLIGGDQGKLKYGPKSGYSCLYEAIRGDMEIVPCFSFGNIDKQMYSGPSTATLECQPFVPTPKDIADVTLPAAAQELHTKLAENMHELWAMHKIENGWTWGPDRDELDRTHPCIAPYSDIPEAEKDYNLHLALDSIETIRAMGYYHMNFEAPPTFASAQCVRPTPLLPGNGYKPGPMDVREELELNESMIVRNVLAVRRGYNCCRGEGGRGWDGLTQQ